MDGYCTSVRPYFHELQASENTAQEWYSISSHIPFSPIKYYIYTSPKIDVFWTTILTLLAPTGNSERVSFLVHQVPGTSATVLWYRWMFSLQIWASKYTCRPIIANLLYHTTATNEKVTRMWFLVLMLYSDRVVGYYSWFSLFRCMWSKLA